MTDRRFALAEHLLETKPWQLFAMVEMGPDRIHHGFWKYMDPEHRKHEPGNPYEQAIRDYYRHVDGLIGRLLEHADDETTVLVVSDHGAKRLDGGIRINEWLRREGLLALQAEPEGVCRPNDVGIDWSKTVAWGDGGYYARVFFNVEGREPEGIVAPADYEAVRDDLTRRLEAIPDDRGGPLATRVYKPEEVYAEVNGVAPDLIAIFGDLLWRSVATIGGDEGVHTLENDTGPDDANHAQDGIFIAAGAGIEARGQTDLHLLDIAPTVLELLGLAIPETMRGRSLAALKRAGVNLVVYVSDALRTDHVGCYGARHVARRRSTSSRGRRPLRPGDRHSAVDGALDRVDDHRPLSAPARLPPLGRRARPRVPDALHGRGGVRLRDGQLRLRRELPVQRLPRRERRRDERAARRRARVDRGAPRPAVLPLVPQLGDAHALRRRSRRARGVAAPRRTRSSRASSPAPRRARGAARELPPRGRAPVRDAVRLVPRAARRPRPAGEDGGRPRRRPRRVVGRALRRQGGREGHLPHARRRALRRGRRRCR